MRFLRNAETEDWVNHIIIFLIFQTKFSIAQFLGLSREQRENARHHLRSFSPAMLKILFSYFKSTGKDVDLQTKVLLCFLSWVKTGNCDTHMYLDKHMSRVSPFPVYRGRPIGSPSSTPSFPSIIRGESLACGVSTANCRLSFSFRRPFVPSPCFPSPVMLLVISPAHFQSACRFFIFAPTCSFLFS